MVKNNDLQGMITPSQNYVYSFYHTSVLYFNFHLEPEKCIMYKIRPVQSMAF